MNFVFGVAVGVMAMVVVDVVVISYLYYKADNED